MVHHHLAHTTNASKQAESTRMFQQNSNPLMNRFMMGGTVTVIDMLLALFAAPVLSPIAMWLEGFITQLCTRVADGLPVLMFTVYCKRLTMVCKVTEDSKHHFVNCCDRTAAITHYLLARNLPLEVTVIGKHCESAGNSWSIKMADGKHGPMYVIHDTPWHEIESDLYFRCRTRRTIEKISIFERNSEMNVVRAYYDFTSRKRSVADINKWIDDLTEARIEELAAKERAKNNRYHFIYRGHTTTTTKVPAETTKPAADNDAATSGGEVERNTVGVPKFTKSILSSKRVQCFDRLDRLYHPHVDHLRRDLAQLRNQAYFQEHGGKRKMGRVFSGPPGTGKTATVAALANEDGRHILEIPWSRMKTNAHLEDLINLRCIDGVCFEPSEVLILFEEIDRGNEMFGNDAGGDDNGSATAAANTQEDGTTASPAPPAAAAASVSELLLLQMSATPVVRTEDKLHLGTVLSRLDGVANYDRIMFVATTNHLNKLPKSLLRDGRMTSIEFEHMLPQYALAMLRDFYCLEEDEKAFDAETCHAVTELVEGKWLAPSSLRALCDKHESLPSLVAALTELAAKAKLTEEQQQQQQQN